MRSFLGVSFIWIGLVACGGGVSVSTNADNVCSEIAKVACHDLYRCCTEGEIERSLGVTDPRTEPQCKEDLTRRCNRNIAPLDEAISAKRVRFDSELMNHCLDALVAPDDACATVETAPPWVEACMNTAWVGLVPDGVQCFHSFECASKDSVCAPNQTCVAKATAGQPCGQFGCATGLYCQATAGTPTCQPQLGEGQPCTSTTQCQTKLFCDTASPTPTCTSAKDGGQACTSNLGCKSADCLPGICAGSTTQCTSNAGCFSIRRCTNNGAPCSDSSMCGSAVCSMSGGTCIVGGAACPGGVTDTCGYPPLCQQVTCVNRVCSQSQLVIDYCDDALDVLDGLTN
jgi:hypothetical protein